MEQTQDPHNAAPAAPRFRRGFRQRSSRTALGLPLYDIAVGADVERGEKRGSALGILAFGDTATGVIAVGTYARGLVAFGLFALGVFTFGVVSLGSVAALGVIAVGPLAIGVFAAGLVASGVLSLGVVADGVLAAGHYARGLRAFGPHALNRLWMVPGVAQPAPDLAAFQFFSGWRLLLFDFGQTTLAVLGTMSCIPQLYFASKQWCSGPVFPSRRQVRIQFESTGSGHSFKSPFTAMGGASGVLRVAITEDELWIWIPRRFPFTGTGAMADLDHRIHRDAIRAVAQEGQEVFVLSLTADGQERTIQLGLRNPQRFCEAIETLLGKKSKAVGA